MDTPLEQDFDDLAEMAGEICGTPIAVVNLVDTTRQFFKAEVGLGVRETPLETSFCREAILAEDMMIVPDASRDPRFDSNPLVVGAPGLRFYAGALLKSPDGLPIGTLCVLDYVSRELTAHQIKALRFLTRQVMTLLELRRMVARQRHTLDAAEDAQRQSAILARIAEQSTDFIGMADTQGVPFFVNDAGRKMVGLEGVDVTKTQIIDYCVEEDRDVVLNSVIPAAYGDGYWEGELTLRNFRTQYTVPVLYNLFSIRDANDELIGFGTASKDITVQRLEQSRRADITREMAHRIKNILGMVQAVVGQTFRSARTMEEGREAISGRLNALAAAQDILTSTDVSVARISDIVETALVAHQAGDGQILMAGPQIDLTAPQALGLSLAIHELATNATKYGALSEAGGRVDIAWTADRDGRFRFEWTETDGPAVTAPTRFGFGSKLVERIVGPYFNGDAKLDFDPAGVRFRLEGDVSARLQFSDGP